MSRILPQRPNLEHLKAQAKALLRSFEEGGGDALERYRAISARPLPSPPRLADAQFVVAREYGFDSWPKLKAHVEAVTKGVDPVQALVAAVKSDEVAEVRRLLEDYPAVKARLDDALPGLPFEATVLLAAVNNKNREMIQVLLDAGADINQKSHWWAGGFGVLDSDSASLVPFLLERGAVLGPNAASRLGKLDELKALVARDPSMVHARGGDGQTPLHVAATVAIAEFLIDQGADIDALDVDHESTPAQYLIKDHPEIVRYLVSQGSRTDILLAAALGDDDLVRKHLEQNPASIRTTVGGRDFPMKDPKAGGIIYHWTLGVGKSPHMVAHDFGHQTTYQLLLDHTPDDYKVQLEHRKLPDAARDGNAGDIRRMLEAGWPLDARGDENATALHWAAWLGYAPIVRELVKAGAPVDIRGDNFNMSPLGWAIHGSRHGWNCRTGDFRGVVETLLQAGATVPQLPPDADVPEDLRALLVRA